MLLLFSKTMEWMNNGMDAMEWMNEWNGFNGMDEQEKFVHQRIFLNHNTMF